MKISDITTTIVNAGMRNWVRTLSEGECEVFEDEGTLVLYCEQLQTVKYRDPVSAKV